MGDPISAHSKHRTTLRNKFELEKRHLPSVDFHYEDVKSRLNVTASPSNQSQKQPVGNKEIKRDEIIKHMLNLPNYLETGKSTPDRALSFGVMDWGKLQKWQYQHLNKCSPSSWSTSGQTRSPAGQKPHRVTLQSHFNCTEKKTTRGSETDPKDGKMSDSCRLMIQESKSFSETGNFQIKTSSLKGKMKIQDEAVNTHALDDKISERIRSDMNNLQMEPGSARNPIKRLSFSSKKSDIKMDNITPSKQTSMSPIRRYSFSASSKSTVSRKLATDNTSVAKNRSQSSPLRRLLEPLFPLKATNSRQCTEKPHEDLHRNKTPESTLTTQALFRSTVKNGQPLFTFAVENNNNILAATVKDSSCVGKSNSDSRIYTFFTIDEIKKKKGSWLTQSRRVKGQGQGQGQGYVPNVTAQMKVSNYILSNCDIREFSLFRVDPYDEVAAIVVKFSRKLVGEEEGNNRDRFDTTVVLPGGNHGVSSNRKPSPLIDRWRSGGGCDCGGWDLGCRLKTFTNQVQSSGRSKSTIGQFELFFQGDVIHERLFFSFSPLKEGISSVGYNSSLSPLQALSICISVVECRKSSNQQTESRMYVAKQVQDDPNPISFASFPPLSPVGRV